MSGGAYLGYPDAWTGPEISATRTSSSAWSEEKRDLVGVTAVDGGSHGVWASMG
jgi:hypothetical protein